jgi:hypothetical protein
MISESFIKYLAGLLDADGHLAFTYTEDSRNKEYFCVGLRVFLGSSSQVDKHGFVASLPSITGFGSTYMTPNYLSGKTYTNWSVAKSSHLEMLLPRIIKHMVIKAKHWQWMFDIYHNIKNRGHSSQAVHASERDSLEQGKKESRKFNVGPLRPKNYPTWAWLAGYLDGDGWFIHRDTSKKRYGMQVGACAHVTDSGVLEFLMKAYGGAISTHSQSENVKVWKRSLSNQNRAFALRFLPKVVKHSRLKKHKIEIMIHHHQQRLTVPSSKEQVIV